MAVMDNIALVQRFIRLPLSQRRAFLEKLAGKGLTLGQLPIPAAREGLDVIPLSYAQQRQWFLWQLEPHSSAYHIPSALRLKGTLDVRPWPAASSGCWGGTNRCVRASSRRPRACAR
ncbi:condensation domain-containing protein [Pseudomonas sp. BNK-43-a]|uniref:condensation domain-containing protein n=1 Tax=Pseudomonas sp. BNK-43-a TaxID=3376176 RepID=UPI0039BF3D7E